MVKILRYTISVMLFAFAIFFLGLFVKKALFTNYESVFSEPISISDSVECYYTDDLLYVVDSNEGIVQIFDNLGDFQIGYNIPNQGGMILAGLDYSLRIYSVRQSVELEFFGLQYNTKSVHYDSPKLFFESFESLKPSYHPNKGIVKIEHYDSPLEIKLNADSSFLTRDFCIIMFVLFFIAFLIVSEKYKELINYRPERRNLY